MSESLAAMIDVRDMLCAQALARVAGAVKRLPMGQTVDVLYNTEDVRRDLMTWATEQGHEVREVSIEVQSEAEGIMSALRIHRRR